MFVGASIWQQELRTSKQADCEITTRSPTCSSRSPSLLLHHPTKGRRILPDTPGYSGNLIEPAARPGRAGPHCRGGNSGRPQPGPGNDRAQD
eukprot:752895-Hanusia_phi.AAC.1